MPCPSGNCSAARPPQRDLSAGEREVMGNPPWASGAARCTYCGCVHSDAGQGRRTVQGYLDNSLAGNGWRPTRSA